MADLRWCVVVALAISCAGVFGNDVPTHSSKKNTSEAALTVTSNHSTTTISKPNPDPINTNATDLTSTTTVVPTKSDTPSTTTTPKPAPAPATTSKPAPAPPTTPKPAPAPTTTTSKPDPAPTTTTSKPDPAPPTTTPPAPVPPPAPKPVDPPTVGVWNYTDDKTNFSCIIIKFAVQFNFSYAAGKEMGHARFNLPQESRVTDGGCGNSSQWITLSWPPEQDAAKQNNFTLKYKINATSEHYYISEVTLALVYNPVLFPNASSTQNMQLRNVSKEWSTRVSNSYRCKRPQTLKLTTDADGTSGSLVGDVTMSEVQEEAFRIVKGHQFGIAVDCETMDVPDAVPIAVGCALGVLVLVVLGAYLVGRRRSAARGYVSM